MTELVTLLSTGKGTWAQTIKLMKNEDWEKIVIITNPFGRDTLKNKENLNLIVIDSRKPIHTLVGEIKEQLEKEISGIEVAFNCISGSGKEHMAVLSALLKMGLGIRLVTYAKDAVEEI